MPPAPIISFKESVVAGAAVTGYALATLGLVTAAAEVARGEFTATWTGFKGDLDSADFDIVDNIKKDRSNNRMQ